MIKYLERKKEYGRRIYNRFYWRFEAWYDRNLIKIAVIAVTIGLFVTGYFVGNVVKMFQGR